MSRPIKILQVLGSLDRGGAEICALEILRHVDRRHFESHFCVLSGLPGVLADQIRAAGGQVHLLARGRSGFAGRFRALLAKHRFDAVQSQVLYYSGFLLRLAAQCRAPIRTAVLHSSHDGRRSGPGRWLYRRLMRRWIDRYATDVVAVSEGAMAGAWREDWKSDPRCRVIYNGLDLRPFDAPVDVEQVRREFALPGHAPLYVHVGRMRKAKNHLRLLSIFAEMLRRQPAARLLLVGEGGNRIERDVRRRIAELGIADHLTVCGERSDVPRLLKAAAALIFPSRWEGLPGAVLEACAAGTPVLASDLPGVREIAARLPRVRCLSLEAEDACWARALQEVSATAGEPKARWEARRAFARSAFTMDRCIADYGRIWLRWQPKPAGRDAA